MVITIHIAEDIAQMHVAYRLAPETLDCITLFVVPGVTIDRLGQPCHTYTRDVRGTVPTPLNYIPPGYPPFPTSIYTSVNDVICYGVLGGKVLEDGDVVNLDIAVVTKEGYHGDTSRMFVVGEDSILAKHLTQVAFECMWKDIAAVYPDARFGDIGHVVQQHAEAVGYSVMCKYCGYGIDKKLHRDLQILHCDRPGTGMKLEASMIFTIEPTINVSKRSIRTMPDQWTVSMHDCSLLAQREHTFLVIEIDREVLTVSASVPPVPEFMHESAPATA